MLRCILLALPLTASALHSPSLQEVDASEAFAGDDTALKVAADDQEEIENEQDKDFDVDESADSFAEVAADVDVDDDFDGDDDDDDDDELDLDDIDGVPDDDDGDLDLDSDDDDDLGSLVEESGEAGEDYGDDSAEDDEGDDYGDDDDDDDDEELDEDGDDKEDTDAAGKDKEVTDAAGTFSTVSADGLSFKFAPDMPFEKGPTDKASVLAKAKAAGKPAMVLATVSWCPHCQALAKSMNADPGMKTLMSKFVAFHAPDKLAKSWFGELTYTPRAFFYSQDGQQIDVHSPYKKYPYFFDSSKILQAGMRKALGQA